MSEEPGERPGPRLFRATEVLGVELLLLATAVVVTGAVLGYLWQGNAYRDVGAPPRQPIAFSHKHHVGDDGIDCRYCHTTVESTAHAGMPSAHVCLSCHSQLYRDQPILAPLRASAASGEPLRWTRVHALPDFVYFNHAVHVAKGVACVECHGRVDHMPLTWQAAPLTMQWCLDCHRDPGPHLHPADEVFAMDARETPTPDAVRDARMDALHDRFRRTDCSTCHR